VALNAASIVLGFPCFTLKATCSLPNISAVQAADEPHHPTLDMLYPPEHLNVLQILANSPSHFYISSEIPQDINLYDTLARIVLAKP